MPLVAIALQLVWNGPCGSHGVTQVAIQSQIASQGTRAIHVHDAGIAMHYLHLLQISIPWGCSATNSLCRALCHENEFTQELSSCLDRPSYLSTSVGILDAYP
jgi:hypothetical protein